VVIDRPARSLAVVIRASREPRAIEEFELPATTGAGEPRTEIRERDIQSQVELPHGYGLLPRTFDTSDVLAR
jgi:hypothetical protein